MMIICAGITQYGLYYQPILEITGHPVEWMSCYNKPSCVGEYAYYVHVCVYVHTSSVGT